MLYLIVAGLLAAPPATADSSTDAQKSAERGLVFLEQDAVKWRKERECSTCHHGTMTIWAFSEAKNQGYQVPEEFVSESLKWTKDRLLERIDQPRDMRPGWSMVNSSALTLAVMAQCLPKQDALSADDLKRITAHLLRHQEADGSWAWSSAPAKNRPPPFFESDEVATRLGEIALSDRGSEESTEPSPIHEARRKAAAWREASSRTDTTQALVLDLLAKVIEKMPAEIVQPAVNRLIERQREDGGWGQVPDAASDAYATGQVLYVLNLAGVARERDQVRRGVTFLVSTQREDGSWPMKRRSHPGVTPSDFVVPITYFGSAWGTLGLLRSAPKGESYR